SVHPSDGVVLAEDERVLVVEDVVVRGKAAVERCELFCLGVIQLDLSRARAGEREVLRELVRRRVGAVRRLLLWTTNPRRDPHAPLAVHRHGARIGLPLPYLLVAPHWRP